MRKCVGLLSALTLVSAVHVVRAEDVKSAEELPEAVRTTLAKEAQGATIEDVEREQRAGATVYEVEIERNNEEWKLTIDEKGKVIDRVREVEGKTGSTPQTKPETPPQTQRETPSQMPSQPKTK